jgi:hypothetical protein
MKAITAWFKNSFVEFLSGLQTIGEQSPLRLSADLAPPTCPKCSSPLPTDSSPKPPSAGKKPAGAKADFQRLLDDAGVRYFTADEVFYRGARDAKLQLNTDPPRGLWPSLLAVVKVADEARHRLGKPLRITSGFRSVAYNRAIKGAVGSFHTKAAALDLAGSPATLHKILTQMRSEGLFRGGIGRYKTFCHVDVRGKNVDWQG